MEAPDPFSEMEMKLQGMEDRLLRQDQRAAAAAGANNFAAGNGNSNSPTAGNGNSNSPTGAVPNDNNDPNHDPMMAMLYRMEQKIETLQNRIDGRASAVSNFPAAATAATTAAARAAAPAPGKPKRGRPPKRKRPPKSSYTLQPQQPYAVDDDDTLMPPSKLEEEDDDDPDDNAADGKPKSGKSGPRINWAKSPHRERLARVLHDWWSRTGLAIDDETGEPITCHREYSRKTGIARTTLFKYLHKDPRKRRVISARGDTYGGRGKKPLIDERGAQLIVAELKSKAEANNEGFSRQEAIGIIMEHYSIDRQAATRQFTRRILPVLREHAMTLGGEEEATGHDDSEFSPPAQEVQQLERLEGGTLMPDQPRRSIVISGVTSGLGSALFRHYCNNGHDVAGCGWDHEEIRSLQLQFPHARLSVVNITDDGAVAQWAAELERGGTEVDVVVASVEVSPEADRDAPAWEVSREDFDDTIDVNVKGVSNMVRHFVPRMIQTHCGAESVGDIGGVGGTFVAMSSGLGRSPDPHHAAYCASKFAIEGMMKSVAMSLPAPLCAVPLAPGRVAVGEEGKTSNHGVSNDVHRWVTVAGSMILQLNRKDNGRSLSVKGFHTGRDMQSWIIQDGTGVPT